MHPRRQAIHESRTFGDQAADQITALVGSWRFVIWQNIIVLAWIAFNLVAIFGWHWDPYPFILLNLVFSWQASNTGPLLQLTGNRQAAKDRVRDDIEAHEVDELHETVRQVDAMQKQQMEILARVDQLQTEQMTILVQLGGGQSAPLRLPVSTAVPTAVPTVPTVSAKEPAKTAARVRKPAKRRG